MSIPTVTVGEAALTPTQAIVQDANRIVHVTDSRGRNIGVRRMNMSVRRRTLKAISTEQQDKSGYLDMAMMAACVVSIDGQPVDPLAGAGHKRPDQVEADIDGLIDRLDTPGFRAVGKAILDNFPPEPDTETLKNS